MTDARMTAGRLRLPPRKGIAAVRVLARITAEADGCWLWPGALTHDGYGRIQDQGKARLAHRVVYEHLIGPVPSELQLDHLCRVRRCVNPSHLEPVTLRENLMRGNTPARLNADKTQCPKGHEYAGDNLVNRADGARGCRACTLERDRIWKRNSRKARR